MFQASADVTCVLPLMTSTVGGGCLLCSTSSQTASQLISQSVSQSVSQSCVTGAQVSDGVMGTAQGVLRGCGRQKQLMVYNLVVGFESTQLWPCTTLVFQPTLLFSTVALF
jgi:Na+-driven multidrug efflux pump